MKIIHSILRLELFTAQPPVLVDIGASGEINSKWKAIVPYSICLAFDADDREFNINEETNSNYKKLITFNRIVTANTETGYSDFYLTASPFCSSTLEPDMDKLSCWSFKDLFKVTSKAQLPVITLDDALAQANINYIDWFKSDTQGTDLRLLTNLSPAIRSNILAAEFEPGILDAYKGEDKLYSVMEYMHAADYWLSSIEVKGIQRYNRAINTHNYSKAIRTSPGWAEVTYLRQPGAGSKRQLLLLLVFALLEKQFGFALELCDYGLKNYPDAIFDSCKIEIFRKIKIERLKIPFSIAKRRINRLLKNNNS